MPIYQQTLTLLQQLEIELKLTNKWSNTSPSLQQLSSTEPFAIDTLTFEQWLQFIFIPKITTLINNKIPLPSNMSLSPIAEEVFSQKQELVLLTTINKIDDVFNTQINGQLP